MRYNLSQQEQRSWCLPACLQAVLRRYDMFEEQREIAKELETDETGTRVERIGEFLWNRGFSFEDYNYNQVQFNEPELLLGEAEMRGHDVLVDIPIRGENLKHFLLLQEVKRNNIVLLDPDGLGTLEVNLRRIYGEMFQREMGGFGVIQKT